ncbi:MAG: hypothetical protein AMS27_02605 [Bacteroides sp. SM23_62_1]|nr:MAG: hypothetical protein AMS27_02605 [Bacteroides sp. SM23_62_1]
MERYIEQLIEDLRKARNYDDPPEIMEDFLISQVEKVEDHLADVEEYLNGSRQPLSQILGVETERLPSPERLSDDQAALLAIEMEKLWKHFRFYPSYPADDLPGKVRYRLLRDNWDIDQVCLSTGAIGVEFCDYDDENCPLPEYCNDCELWKAEYDEVNDSQKEKKERAKSVEAVGRNADPDFRRKVDKAKELMSRMPVREEYISGIYNYCDRWCEKCGFTKRCLNWAMGREMGDESEEMDIHNKAFWEQLSVIFQATFEFLSEKAEEMGIELDAEPEVEDAEEETEEEAIQNSPHIALAHEYSLKAHKWFEENRNSLEKAIKNISVVNENELVNLKDAIEVIQWYHIFIYVKLRRAQNSLRDEKEEEDSELAEMMADHTNGTAKIALIATDRSLAAFGYLLENMKDKEDEILIFLTMLGKIRNMTEKTYPRARDFKRPGFDE